MITGSPQKLSQIQLQALRTRLRVVECELDQREEVIHTQEDD